MSLNLFPLLFLETLLCSICPFETLLLSGIFWGFSALQHKQVNLSAVRKTTVLYLGKIKFETKFPN